MTDEAKELVEWRYLLVKRGLYYAPDRQGYTGLKAKAGRYREVDALGLDGVTAIHEDEAQDFAPACWEETKLAHLNGIIEAQAREIERLRERVKQLNEGWDAMGTKGQAIIDRLRAENDQLREALNQALLHRYGDWTDIVRAALEARHD